jgi:osmotically-inducible protein OsmY
MKYISRIIALAIFSAFLAGCAGTVQGVKKDVASATVTDAEDAAVQKNVQAALAKEPQLKGTAIDASVKNGAVTLTGSVKNSWLKYLAESTTKKADKNVKSVKNSIKVTD